MYLLTLISLFVSCLFCFLFVLFLYFCILTEITVYLNFFLVYFLYFVFAVVCLLLFLLKIFNSETVISCFLTHHHKKFRVDNVAVVYYIALLHRAELLKRYCVEIIFQQYGLVKTTQSWFELPLDVQDSITEMRNTWWKEAQKRGRRV